MVPDSKVFSSSSDITALAESDSLLTLSTNQSGRRFRVEVVFPGVQVQVGIIKYNFHFFVGILSFDMLHSKQKI